MDDKSIIYWDKVDKMWIVQSLKYGQPGGGQTLPLAIEEYEHMMKCYWQTVKEEKKKGNIIGHCNAPQEVVKKLNNACPFTFNRKEYWLVLDDLMKNVEAVQAKYHNALQKAINFLPKIKKKLQKWLKQNKEIYQSAIIELNPNGTICINLLTKTIQRYDEKVYDLLYEFQCQLNKTDVFIDCIALPESALSKINLENVVAEL